MSGLKFQFVVKKSFTFSEAEKRMILDDYLQSGLTKQAIWEKYTGCKREHGRILEWMHKYGYCSDHKERNSNFTTQKFQMKADHTNREQSDIESLQLQKRISDLENQLRDSGMKVIAWQTMIELAEKEFNISIKKSSISNHQRNEV